MSASSNPSGVNFRGLCRLIQLCPPSCVAQVNVWLPSWVDWFFIFTAQSPAKDIARPVTREGCISPSSDPRRTFQPGKTQVIKSHLSKNLAHFPYCVSYFVILCLERIGSKWSWMNQEGTIFFKQSYWQCAKHAKLCSKLLQPEKWDTLITLGSGITLNWKDFNF